MSRGITPCAEDGDLWFADGRKKQQEAKRRCGDCPVRLACLDLALQSGETWGIWGGTDPLERKAMSQPARTNGPVIVEVAA